MRKIITQTKEAEYGLIHMADGKELKLKRVIKFISLGVVIK